MEAVLIFSVCFILLCKATEKTEHTHRRKKDFIKCFHVYIEPQKRIFVYGGCFCTAKKIPADILRMRQGT